MDWSPLLLSFKVATLATLLTAILGVGIGALLATTRFPGRDLVDVLITVPMVLPPTVLGYYVLVAVGRGSMVNHLWENLFGGPLVFTRTGAVVAATIGSLPLVVKSARASLEGINVLYLNAARTLGAGALRSFFMVRLPLAAGGVFAGIILGYARALGDFGVTIMVAGNIPGETQTAPLAIYDAIHAGRDSAAAAMALILSGFALVTLYLVGRLNRKVHS